MKPILSLYFRLIFYQKWYQLHPKVASLIDACIDKKTSKDATKSVHTLTNLPRRRCHRSKLFFSPKLVNMTNLYWVLKAACIIFVCILPTADLAIIFRQFACIQSAKAIHLGLPKAETFEVVQLAICWDFSN